ncbi:MAG: hypothetical protein EBX95_04515 [Acidimicrobiia bacterium]|nr:hypothetical protein [Acidimicrobiia bacterium]
MFAMPHQCVVDRCRSHQPLDHERLQRTVDAPTIDGTQIEQRAQRVTHWNTVYLEHVKILEITGPMHDDLFEAKPSRPIGAQDINDIVRCGSGTPKKRRASMTGHCSISNDCHCRGDARDRVEFPARNNRDTRIHLADQTGIAGGSPRLHRVAVRNDFITDEDHVRRTRKLGKRAQRDFRHHMKWEFRPSPRRNHSFWVTQIPENGHFWYPDRGVRASRG